MLSGWRDKNKRTEVMHGWIDKYIRAEVMYGLSDKCSYIRPEVVYTSRTIVWLKRCDCENICIRVELLSSGLIGAIVKIYVYK